MQPDDENAQYKRRRSSNWRFIYIKPYLPNNKANTDAD